MEIKMTKYFCDLCSKEMTSTDYAFKAEIDYNHKIIEVDIIVYKDCCESCMLKIIKCIKPNDILENPDDEPPLDYKRGL